MADDYSPPSSNEIMSWWNSLNYEDQVLELKKLDAIEHSIPEINLPEFTAILSISGDLFIKLEGPINIKIDYLQYEMEMDPVKIKGFYKPKKKGLLDYALPVGVGLGASLLGTAIAEKAEPWQYGLSALGGAGLGLIIIFSL